MNRSRMTYLFCLDELRNFSEDIKNRFSDNSKYSVIIAHNKEEFIRNIARKGEHKCCRIALIESHNNDTEPETTRQLIKEIRKTSPHTAIILLVLPQVKIEEPGDEIKYDVDAYMPLNINTILRVHNNVKKLISEFNLQILRRKRSFSFWILLIFLLASVIFAVIAYFRLPIYF